MGQTKINWHQKEVVIRAETLLEENMLRAATYAEGKVKKNISRGNKSGAFPSKPGEFPKVVTGTLRASIGHEVRKDSRGVYGYVGVRKGVATADAEPYAMKLELKGRSFLRRTIIEEGKKIFKLILGK